MPNFYPTRMQSPAGADRTPTAEELRRRAPARSPSRPKSVTLPGKIRSAVTTARAGIAKLRGR